MRSIMAELQKSFKGSSMLSASVVVLLLWLNITARISMAATRVVPVGVILDLTSKLGYMVNNSLALAVEDYYFDHPDTATKIDLIVKNVSRFDAMAAAGAASDFIMKEKVRAILGPQNSEQARFIVNLGEESQVPVIWFPITGPSLLPPPYPYSNQGLNCFQFQAIADAMKSRGWQTIVPIYEDTEYGSQLIPCLSNVLKDMGIRMANVTAVKSDATSIVISSTLDKLNSMRTHAFLVHMSMDLGTQFILSAQEKEMMGEGYAWILTLEFSSMTDPQVMPGKPLRGYMQGALGVRPMDSNKTGFRRISESIFKSRYNSSLTIYGWWAYHTLEALAMALEKPGTDNGLTLRSDILDTDFKGRSGVNFDLREGRLDQSVLEVYKVIGDRERVIGYWSPETGLVQNYSKPVKTSGDTSDEAPKLRIGVPIPITTNYFPEFVNVDNNSGGEILVGGFAVDVFLKAVDVLASPFNNYEFVPLTNQSRSDTPMTYDDILCRQMKVQGLDAVIGDITILANRTKCVDFSLPYLDSSVTMVVRVKTSPRKWILFKPFKWSLWFILGGIFVTATIIIIILEWNKTNKFHFNPFLVYKIDVTDNFTSIAAGWMVILTSFLFILILQVYTANLTSILTEGKMRGPSFEDENEIKSNNLSVGYRNGSWVEGLLINQIRFHPFQLKALRSREEYNEELSIESKNGGVDAIFDEIPYLKLFLFKYKSQYMMTGPIYKTGGYAFAFPRKSSLVSQYSKAILNVTHDVESYRALMAKNSLPTSIEDFGYEDQSDKEITGLKIDYFGGLYPILASVLALSLGLLILNPHVIKWLRKKLSKPSSINQCLNGCIRRSKFSS